MPRPACSKNAPVCLISVLPRRPGLRIAGAESTFGRLPPKPRAPCASSSLGRAFALAERVAGASPMPRRREWPKAPTSTVAQSPKSAPTANNPLLDVARSRRPQKGVGGPPVRRVQSLVPFRGGWRGRAAGWMSPDGAAGLPLVPRPPGRGEPLRPIGWWRARGLLAFDPPYHTLALAGPGQAGHLKRSRACARPVVREARMPLSPELSATGKVRLGPASRPPSAARLVRPVLGPWVVSPSFSPPAGRSAWQALGGARELTAEKVAIPGQGPPRVAMMALGSASPVALRGARSPRE